eukprot:gene9193-8279_t
MAPHIVLGGTKIGFYQGNGTSHPRHNDGFYATIEAAAAMAFTAGGFDPIKNLTEADVSALAPGDFDMVVFPGGSGNGQATAVGEDGLTALRAFVGAGGGY